MNALSLKWAAISNEGETGAVTGAQTSAEMDTQGDQLNGAAQNVDTTEIDMERAQADLIEMEKNSRFQGLSSFLPKFDTFKGGEGGASPLNMENLSNLTKGGASLLQKKVLQPLSALSALTSSFGLGRKTQETQGEMAGGGIPEETQENEGAIPGGGSAMMTS